MGTLSEADIKKLKHAGFQRWEISHIKAGRTDRVSKKKLLQIKRILQPKIKRAYNKPIMISGDNIKLKPFVKLKPIGGNNGKKKRT